MTWIFHKSQASKKEIKEEIERQKELRNKANRTIRALTNQL